MFQSCPFVKGEMHSDVTFDAKCNVCSKDSIGLLVCVCVVQDGKVVGSMSFWRLLIG